MRRDRRPSERTCVATRRTDVPERMIRFVQGPDGRVVPDVRRRLPGRGAWLDGERSVVERAVRRNPFRRAFGGEAQVAEDLADTVDALLADHALSTLAMANKAGLVVSGFEKVREGLRRGRVAVLVAAADGAEDGRARLSRLASHAGGAHNGALFVNVFQIADLSRTLGRERVVHAGIAGHPLAEAFVARAARLARYRGRAEDVGRLGAASGGAGTDGSADLSEREVGERDAADAVSETERQTTAFAGTRAV